MKHAILMAVAGGLLSNTVSHNTTDKKNDLFYKADKKVHKCTSSAKNINLENQEIFKLSV